MAAARPAIGSADEPEHALMAQPEHQRIDQDEAKGRSVVFVRPGDHRLQSTAGDVQRHRRPP